MGRRSSCSELMARQTDWVGLCSKKYSTFDLGCGSAFLFAFAEGAVYLYDPSVVTDNV